MALLCLLIIITVAVAGRDELLPWTIELAYFGQKKARSERCECSLGRDDSWLITVDEKHQNCVEGALKLVAVGKGMVFSFVHS